MHFFDISTSKSAPKLRWFVHFDLETCFAPQRRALFRHLNFQKWSGVGVFCTFWLGNVLRATTACNFSSHLASWPRTRRFSEPTFRPSGATNHWKNTVSHDFPTFSRTWIFFLLRLSLFWSSFFFSSLTLPIFAFHLPILSEVWLLNFLRLHLFTLCLYLHQPNLRLPKCAAELHGRWCGPVGPRPGRCTWRDWEKNKSRQLKLFITFEQRIGREGTQLNGVEKVGTQLHVVSPTVSEKDLVMAEHIGDDKFLFGVSIGGLPFWEFSAFGPTTSRFPFRIRDNIRAAVDLQTIHNKSRTYLVGLRFTGPSNYLERKGGDLFYYLWGTLLHQLRVHFRLWTSLNPFSKASFPAWKNLWSCSSYPKHSSDRLSTTSYLSTSGLFTEQLYIYFFFQTDLNLLLAENFEIIFFAKTNFLLKRRLVDFGIDTSTFFHSHCRVIAGKLRNQCFGSGKFSLWKRVLIGVEKVKFFKGVFSFLGTVFTLIQNYLY